jgi:indole-3-glycerol phosphate synthase
MSYLDDLLSSTRARIADGRLKLPEDGLEQRLASVPAPTPFVDALRGPDMAVIAEIKRATPRAGDLNLQGDASSLAAAYAEGGAAALSVLTEPRLFKGSVEDLQNSLGAGLPVLRKDFILDPWQILETRAMGADALLLIVRILGDELSGLVAGAHALGLDVLVEVFDEDEVERALAAGARCIGINHRDLSTFEVDPGRTARLAPLIPDEVVVVALSGVSATSQMVELAEAGAHAVLVGESLVTASDPAAKLRELLAR